MTANHTETRRGILNLFLLTATGAAASALSACAVNAGESEAGGVPYEPGVLKAAEVVPLRPGVAYRNVLPARIPAVRLLPTAGSL